MLQIVEEKHDTSKHIVIDLIEHVEFWLFKKTVIMVPNFINEIFTPSIIDWEK